MSSNLGEFSGVWLGRLFGPTHMDARRSAAGAYLAGLLDSNPRKSLRAIADRSNEVAYHQIHHFLNSSAVIEDIIRAELLLYAGGLFNKSSACIVIEDVVIQKRGDKSAGVAEQSNSSEHKKINCQIVVSVAIVRGGRVVPIAMHLINSQKLAPARGMFDGGSLSWHAALASEKAKIIVRELSRIRRSGIHIAGIILDATIWNDSRIRKILSREKMKWIVRVPFSQEFYRDSKINSRDVSSHAVSDEKICGSEMLSSSQDWTTPHMHFSACTNWPKRAGRELVRLDASSPWSDGSGAGRLVQLVVEIYLRGEKECYISNMHVTRDVHTVVEVMQNYWFCRKAHAQMTARLGLAKFEGRSQVGLRRHLLLVSIAYIYSENHSWMDRLQGV